MKLRILHSSYGCDSGCCGHRVETEKGDPRHFHFEFDHAEDDTPEDRQALAVKLVGEENLADVDFENSKIVSYGEC